MYKFRPFRNADTPRLAAVWRDQPPQRGIMQPISVGLFEQLVLAKPYFDPDGLIVATKNGDVVGFAHAGFGANEDCTDIETDWGTTYQLMVAAPHRDDKLADDLLANSEAYLSEHGATVIYAGGIRPLDAFYLGLYGGSELPGILRSDEHFRRACLRNGYEEVDRVEILQLDLSTYRPPITLAQRQLRRQVATHEVYCPPARTMWEAATMGDFEQLCFSLTAPEGGQTLASVRFWDIEPLSSRWGIPTAGMFDLEVSRDRRRQGLATYLLTAAFERLSSRGIAAVEAQTMQQNESAIALYRSLNFGPIDQGIVYRKAPS